MKLIGYIKHFIVKAITPVLRELLSKNLRYLYPLFIIENKSLKEVLHSLGFHPALCSHPSILIGNRDNNTEIKDSTFLLKLRVTFVKKSIKIGLLKDKRGHALLKEVGIQPYFGNGVDFWFDDPHCPMNPYHLPEVDKPLGKTVVYTTITGDYDKVHEILYRENGVDYLLFTNNPRITSKTWTVIFVESDLDNITLSREIKMMPHKHLRDEYENSIFVDANAVIYGEITNLTRYLHDGNSLAVSRHSIRRTVKDEIEACVKLRGTNRAEAEEQYNSYLREGFKDDMPLLECGILVRRHKDKRLQELMQTWFEEFKNGVKRDQLSLPPCIHRLSFNDYTVMNGNVWHNQFNRITSHRV